MGAFGGRDEMPSRSSSRPSRTSKPSRPASESRPRISSEHHRRGPYRHQADPLHQRAGPAQHRGGLHDAARSGRLGPLRRFALLPFPARRAGHPAASTIRWSRSSSARAASTPRARCATPTVTCCCPAWVPSGSRGSISGMLRRWPATPSCCVPMACGPTSPRRRWGRILDTQSPRDAASAPDQSWRVSGPAAVATTSRWPSW